MNEIEDKEALNKIAESIAEDVLYFVTKRTPFLSSVRHCEQYVLEQIIEELRRRV